MKKGDFLIIAVVVVLLFTWIFMSKGGSTAQIYVDGKLYKEVPLSKDDKVVVESEFGKNTVIIEGGAVKIADSDCPGKDCEVGEIEKTSRSLVCLPNRLTVIIKGEKADDETDVVL